MSEAHRTPAWYKFSRVQRKAWQTRIDASGVPCRRCRGVIRKGTAWHLGHIIDVRLGGALTDPANVWPEHVRCNTQSGAMLGHAVRYRAQREARREPEW
jgi:5-methylcytosine-specific restriction endonuclease McrA